MASAQRLWLSRLSIQNAYGQLVMLIFIPITILTVIGTTIVISEVDRSASAEQRSRAEAVLARYQRASNILIRVLNQPDGDSKARSILQNILGEENVKRAALIDAQRVARLSIGYNADASWPKFGINHQAFGPLKSSVGNSYGLLVGYATDSPIWLVIDMDNKPMALAQYRVWSVLVITGLVTLMFILLCLSFYSTRWIAPIYELRMLLQRLSINNLNQSIDNGSYGEMRLLQKDLSFFLRRLHRSVMELHAHNEQTEDDLRQTLDTIEIQNITYRKARDIALQASNTKSVFLANISHELRTPLNSIDGFINLLSRRGVLSDEQRVYVQTIRKSSAHLLALINNVLDFSKIEAGKLVLEKAPFNLEETVFDVTDMLSPLASDKNLNIAVYYYDDVPRLVNGDALRLRQILTNLVSNAIKFTQQGEITIRVRLEASPHHQPNHHNLIHFSVQDSGIGLNGNSEENLFKSFQQGDPSVTRQYGGTGLGLAIVRQLTQLMGGEVGCEDNTDQGATFWFTALVGVTHENPVDWPQLSNRRVLAYLEHKASFNVLRAYLSHTHVVLEQASSLPDLFGRLTDFEAETQGNGWIIVDVDVNDTPALLREIRNRYSGELVVYGYQMAIDPAILTNYDARALYQPVSREGVLWALQPNTQAPKSIAPHFEGKNLHVLAVDDHAPNLMVLEALLGDLGIQTTKASSGLEAIELIESHLNPASPETPFDLVFMDIQMPKMSGLEATQRIRILETEHNAQNLKPQHTPIIALTAHALSDERDRLLAAGMDDYFSKPIQQAQLVNILERWTGQMKATENTHNDFDNSLTEQDSHPVIDWQLSLKLAAGKVDLARDLLRMLIEALPADRTELIKCWESGDFESLLAHAHRLHGGSRYTGTPTLRKTTGVIERALTNIKKTQPLNSAETQAQVKDEQIVNFSAMIDAIDTVLAYPFEEIDMESH
jgi:two-component system sensor histidine kinase BarA